MYHYFDIAVNKTTGVPIPGVIVRAYDQSGTQAALFADGNGTPIESVSGITDAAVADDAGNYGFYVGDGVYDLRIYSGDALVLSIPSTTLKNGTDVDATLTSLKNASIDNVSRIYGGYIYHWTAGDYTGQADDDAIVESNVADLTTGAWIKQSLAPTDLDGSTGAGKVGAADGNTVQDNLDARAKAADLASTDDGKGLALSSFIQGATGAATDITALDKARQQVSVLDFVPRSEWDDIAAGTSSFDCAGAFNAVITYAILIGAGIVLVPPGVYNCGSKISVTSPIWIVGSWGQYSSGSAKGARLVFSDDVMADIGTAVEISADWVRLHGLAISGVGKVADSSGVRTIGSSGDFVHGFQMDRCAVFGFETGLTVGSYTDHLTVKGGSYLSNNTYGLTIEANNKEDIHLSDSFLDNNTIASVRVLDGATTQNFVAIRTHFGFGEYGFWTDPSATSGGISGLTLIGCPFEACSEGMISLYTLGSANIIGGYWIWNGTPSNPAVKVVGVEYGPITIDVQFQNSNSNSPYVFQATSYSKWPVTIRGSLTSIAGGGFAQALKSANLFPTNLTPTLPASFSEQANNLGFDVMVYVSGGTVSQIVVGLTGSFVDTGLTSGGFRLRNGEKIRITYSAAPTWKWVYG